MDCETHKKIITLARELKKYQDLTNATLHNHAVDVLHLTSELVPRLNKHVQAVTAEQQRSWTQLVGNAELLRESIQANTDAIKALRDLIERMTKTMD